MSCVIKHYAYNTPANTSITSFITIFQFVKKNIWIARSLDQKTLTPQYATLDPTKTVNDVSFTRDNKVLNYKIGFATPSSIPTVNLDQSVNTPYPTPPVVTQIPDFVASGLPMDFGPACCKNNSAQFGVESFSFMKDDKVDIKKVLLYILLILVLILIGYQLLPILSKFLKKSKRK